jgi:hypothetical protein
MRDLGVLGLAVLLAAGTRQRMVLTWQRPGPEL